MSSRRGALIWPGLITTCCMLQSEAISQWSLFMWQLATYDEKKTAMDDERPILPMLSISHCTNDTPNTKVSKKRNSWTTRTALFTVEEYEKYGKSKTWQLQQQPGRPMSSLNKPSTRVVDLHLLLLELMSLHSSTIGIHPPCVWMPLMELLKWSYLRNYIWKTCIYCTIKDWMDNWANAACKIRCVVNGSESFGKWRVHDSEAFGDYTQSWALAEKCSNWSCFKKLHN